MADNPIGRLNEYAQVHSIKVEGTYEDTGPPHSKVFVCTMRMGDKVSEGEGKTKKEAKTQAAIYMLQQLSEDDLPTPRKSLSPIVHRGGGLEGSDGIGELPINAKGSLQELCQKNMLAIPEYRTQDKSGPSHDLSFTVQCIIKDSNGDTIESVYGNGKSKKAAENDAALKMKEKIEVLLPVMSSGISPIKVTPRSGQAKDATKEGIPFEDQVEIDELYAQILGRNFDFPELLMQKSMPADPNNFETVKHLCLALARHSYPSSVSDKCRYDVTMLPVAAQGIGDTEEEAKREALCNLVTNLHLLGL